MTCRRACACIRREDYHLRALSNLLLSRAGRAPGAEDGGGEQEGAVAAAVVVPGRVLVVHDQARHVGRRLHAHHCSVPAALLAVCAPRLIYVDWRMSILEKERTARGRLCC